MRGEERIEERESGRDEEEEEDERRRSGKDETRSREGGRKGTREDVPSEQRRTTRGRGGGRGVERNDDETDDTRHRHIKSTLSKYTIIFIIPGRDRARSEYQLEEYRDEPYNSRARPHHSVNSGSLAFFYCVPPSSSVRLDNVQRDDKVPRV